MAGTVRSSAAASGAEGGEAEQNTRRRRCPAGRPRRRRWSHALKPKAAYRGDSRRRGNGGHKVLTDVYYIPKLKRNIISLGTLAERGCKIVIEEDYL